MRGIDGPLGPAGKRGYPGRNGIPGKKGLLGPYGPTGKQGNSGHHGVCFFLSVDLFFSFTAKVINMTFPKKTAQNKKFQNFLK